MKLPIRTLGLMAAGLLVGTAMSPVAAQQQSGTDYYVALRSDGALYLIANGQRRWISTASLSDSEINAIPEGDAIMTGLALAGSAEAQAKPGGNPPAAAAPPAAAKPATGSGTTAAAPPAATPTTATASAQKPSASPGEELSPDIPVQVDLDGNTKIDPGDERKVEIKTRKDVTCELMLRLPDGEEKSEDSKNADSRGACKFTIEIPENAKEGGAWLVGTVREGGKLNRQEIAITISKKK